MTETHSSDEMPPEWEQVASTAAHLGKTGRAAVSRAFKKGLELSDLRATCVVERDGERIVLLTFAHPGDSSSMVFVAHDEAGIYTRFNSSITGLPGPQMPKRRRGSNPD